jgi:hypothetical protein
VITVAATSPIDASILVKLYAPTTAPPDQTCASPPAATVNQTVSVDLTNHEDAIKDGCFAGGPNAAYDLSLSVPSDVMVVGRFPQTELGGVSLDTPACDLASKVSCATGGTPQRLNKRNVLAGDYRVVINDSLGLLTSLTTLVRPTVAPTIVGGGANSCQDAVDIPAQGGFFTGDTTNASSKFDEGCDAPNVLPGGAPDEVLRLVLTQPQRVVLDMNGSTYTTILDVRSGSTCPGIDVPNACYVGFSGARSFLDLELQAGTYWIIIDGYAMAKGAWNLDVRVLPP